MPTLDSLQAQLDSLTSELSALKLQLASLVAARPQPSLPSVDIRGQYGDPIVRKDPPRWSGPSFVGRKYSQCTPEYLRSMAGFLQWKAGKDDERGEIKFAKYSRIDAARALAWADEIQARSRSQPRLVDDRGGDEIPF